MAQLVKGGPDLPPELFKAQEEGDLVLFCGAGISKPAGLPLFGELVERIYEELAEVPTQIENRLCRAGDYDRALELLERREIRVRDTLRGILTLTEPDLRLHHAILTLSEVAAGHRLVTTNFDRLFLQALPSIARASAPTLPVPRKHRWLSLVHLHGLIDDTDPEARDLVLTSGDFGRAYLLDGWAARFVAELFRNFTILFIGYSVDDPVMRYLTDAIAAEQRHGANFREPYAFAGVSGGKDRQREADEWRSKGVRALTYHKAVEHRALVQTLYAWAELRRGGFHGRRTLALKHAARRPESWQDEEARLVVWALSEPSGTIARAFSEHEPPPPVEWLSVFMESKELPSSLLSMPVLDAAGKPSPVAPPLVGPMSVAQISPVTAALAYWLTRHLGDKRVLDWTLQRGGLLHPAFRRKVRDRLKKDTDIATPFQTIWGLLAREDYARRLIDRWYPDLAFMDRRLEDETWTPILRREVLRALSPFPSLRTGWRDPGDDRPLTIGHLVFVEMHLSDSDFGSQIVKTLTAPDYKSRQEVLADLAFSATSLLLESLEWFSLLGEAGEQYDPSLSAMPSIEPHRMNHHFEGWLYLIDLVRESFLVLDQVNPEATRALISRWRTVRYPLFRRLTLYAATYGQGIDPSIGFRVLTEGTGSALWRSDTRRECMRFLRNAAARLPNELLAELITAVLAGPPRPAESERSSLYKEQWRARAVWSRLIRLSGGGVELSPIAQDELNRLSRFLGEEPVENEEDEFAIWRDDEQAGIRHSVPELLQLDVAALARLLSQSIDEPHERQSLMLAWQGLAGEAPDKALAVLQHLAERNEWLEDAWRYLLNGKSPLLDRPELLSLVVSAPKRLLGAEIHSILRWLEERARDLPLDEERLLWTLFERVLPLALASPVYGVTNHALNHPAGIASKFLLNRLAARSPERGQGLPHPLRAAFESLGKDEGDAGSVARVMLTTRLRFLYSVDPTWTSETVISRLSWTCPEASGLWRSFFWQPRADPDLLAVIKPGLIEAFDHLDELSSTATNACRFLTFASLDLPDSFSRTEISSLLKRLTPRYLADVAGALADALRNLDSAGVGWRERIGPWFWRHWPGRPELRTPVVSEALAEVAVETGDALPMALERIKLYLVPIPKPSSFEHRLEKSSQPERAPEAVLDLLDTVIPSFPEPLSWWRLEGLLDRIESADGSLTGNLRYRRLRDVAARTAL